MYNISSYSSNDDVMISDMAGMPGARTSDSLNEELPIEMAREKFLRKCYFSMERIVVSTFESSAKMFFSHWTGTD